MHIFNINLNRQEIGAVRVFEVEDCKTYIRHPDPNSEMVVLRDELGETCVQIFSEKPLLANLIPPLKWWYWGTSEVKSTCRFFLKE